MKNSRLKLGLAVLTLAQLAVVSCKREALTPTSTTDEISSASGSIYDGQPTELTRRLMPLTSARNANTNDACEEFNLTEEQVLGSFSRLGSGAHLMWPGNLIQGKTIKSGDIGTIPIGADGRNAIEVKVDAFSSGSSTPSNQTIEAPTAGKVQSALEQILEGYYTSGTQFPANYSIDIRRTFNSNQLQLALNIGYTGAEGVSLAGSFGLNFNKSKTYYAVTLKQKFFNVSVYPKSGLQSDLGWIKKDYPSEDVSKYVAANNPAVYISTVTYGRLYALVYESDENSLEVEQALNFAYKNPTTSITADQKLKYTNILKNSRVFVKQLGGNATSGLESSLGAFASNFDLVRDFIVKGAEVSKQNPGYPIEYTAVNVESNLPVTMRVKANSTYTECKQNPYIANSLEEARKGVGVLKDEYGIANCAKITIQNNTNKPLILKSASPWYDSSFYNSPPTYIPAGKFGYLLAVHKAGEAKGTFNQLSYTLGDQIVSLGTYAPWSQFSTNNVLVDFKEITEDELYNNSTKPVNEKTKGNIRVRGKIDNGDAPFVEFTVNQ